MAFLPRVKNAYVPVSNKQMQKRDDAIARRIHLQKLALMEPSIDNKWGCLHNGVREFKDHQYDHVSHNRKRAQLQEERLAEINVRLLYRLRAHTLACKSHEGEAH